MYVQNCWYVAAWNYEIKEDALFSCMIINRPLVIYRKADGSLAAFENRCCHRGAPLSMGRREGDDLRCLYHGLKFAPDGRCIEIPGQERVPANACVKTFPVVEAHSWIWVWMGDPALADPELIPPVMGLDTRGLQSRSGHIEYETYYELINDNLLDFSHLGYVHPTSFGTSEDWAYTRPKITRLPRGLRIERWVTNQPSAHGVEAPNVDIWNRYDFLLPGIVIMDSHAVVVGGAQRNDMGPPDLEKTPALFTQYSCQAVTPVSDNRSRYSYSVLMPDHLAGNGILDGFWAGTLQAFEEDRIIIEAQARINRLDPDRPLVATSFDGALGQFRWLIDKMVKEERAQATQAAQAA